MGDAIKSLPFLFLLAIVSWAFNLPFWHTLGTVIVWMIMAAAAIAVSPFILLVLFVQIMLP